jgi:hypothetical protein
MEKEMRTAVKTPVIKRRRRKFEWMMVLAYAVFPFYKLWRGLVWLYYNICWENIRTGDNGIFGPGYHAYYTERFAWGKLSFFLLLILLIVIGIHYIYG